MTGIKWLPSKHAFPRLCSLFSSHRCHHLIYRTTPLRNGLSPSELLMGRKLKTKVPVLPSTLLPKLPNHALVKEKAKTKEQRENFNKRHAAREASPLRNSDNVFIKDMKTSGEVVTRHHNPRSYIVQTERGSIRRNYNPGGKPEQPMSHQIG